MAKALNVLFLSSEVYPFSKESGLGDVAFSLPLALRELGNDIRVMSPKYGNISERKNKIHEINRLKNVPITVGDKEELATIKSSSINNPRSKVQAYITTNFTYFDSRKGVYNDPKTWKEYPDNAERFIFYCKSVLETCLVLGWFPDIIHCNDWHSALVPIYIKTVYPKQFKKTKVVYTIHNFNHQGVFPLAILKLLEFSEDVLKNLVHKKQVNFLKGGLHYADYITVVSKTYAKDIMKSKTMANGLESMIKDKGENFKGIINKIDTYVWNAEKDPFIKAKYDGDYLDYKYHNKVALINKFGLEYSPSTPLIAMVTNVEDNKGINLLIEQADKIFAEDVQFVLLGQGEPALKDKLAKISAKYPDKFKCLFELSDELTHLTEAGSDIYMLLSEYEPSGLNFMYSLVYGSVPIVYPTGGLTEQVEPFNESTNEGNCLVMKEHTGAELIKTIKQALVLYKNKEQWETLARNGMNTENSWRGTAEEYHEIYKKLAKDA